ncbi:hypothetical protein ABTF84_19775, partial [Acinetobacter baumannii]
MGDSLTADEFRTLQLCSPTLIDRVLTGQLCVPQFQEFCKELNTIFDEVSNCREGKLANYIPQLARVNPEKFS